MDPFCQHLHNLELDSLKALCKSLGLSTLRCTRNDMIQLVNSLIVPSRQKRHRNSHDNDHKNDNVNDHAVIKIQRWWRRLRWIYTNDTDFITLDPIDVPPFRLIEDSKHVYQFNPLHLAEYFLKEGHFLNPYTRRHLYPVELMRLDRILRTRHHANFTSLFEEHKRITIDRAQEREHERTIHMIQQESLQLLTDIAHLANDANVSVDLSLIEITEDILPRYYHTFRQLYLLDPACAIETIILICHALEAMYNNPTVSHTQAHCFLFQFTRDSVYAFCSVMLPIFAAIQRPGQQGGDEEEYNPPPPPRGRRNNNNNRRRRIRRVTHIT